MREHLEKAKKLIKGVIVSMTGPCGGWMRKDIEQALAELEQIKTTEPSEFTKKVSIYFELTLAAIKEDLVNVPKPKLHDIIDDLLKYLTEACDIIDKLNAERCTLKGKLEQIQTVEPSEFTKSVMMFLPPSEILEGMKDILGQIELSFYQACDIIDRLEAEKKQQAERIEQLEKKGNKSIDTPKE
jgi:hypothetical protein